MTLGLEILEGHVSQIREFSIELKTILQPFLVSRHGDLDKGALRRPMLPEAFALSLLDLMDARLEQAFRLIDSAPPEDEFTLYIPFARTAVVSRIRGCRCEREWWTTRN